jgi:hypothetical protein
MTSAWRCKFFVPRTGQAPRAVPQMEHGESND